MSVDERSPVFFFAERGRDFDWQRRFLLVDILIRSGDIRDQSLKLSEIAPTYRLFALSNSTGAGPPKVVPKYSCLPRDRHVAKFRELTPTGIKVITANTLNIMLVFECLLFKIVGGTPVPGGVWVSKPWSFFSTCKYLRRQHPQQAKM